MAEKVVNAPRVCKPCPRQFATLVRNSTPFKLANEQIIKSVNAADSFDSSFIS